MAHPPRGKGTERIRPPGRMAPWALVAAAATAALAQLGLTSFAWNDYDNEARESVTALAHGHFATFAKLAPVYGGSLLERSPFAFLPNLWGGGELAVYRMLALPCLLAAAALALWMVARMGRDGASTPAKALALVLCTANPLTLLALEIGHPDELLGGALCVGAVLWATRGHAAWAGLALGLAIANKQWALLAVGPVLLALPGGRRLCAAASATVAGALLAPFALLGATRLTATVHATATSAGGLFQPWQLWWFLGHRPPPPHTLDATGALATRVAPAWVETISHPLVLALAIPLTYLAWRALHDTPLTAGAPKVAATLATRQRSALALLALLLLVRCMLDPWDNIYYPIPFVLALLAWEALALRRAPLLAFAATVAVWSGHHWMGTFASQDAQAAFFAAWSVPLAIALAVACTSRGGRPAALLDHRQLLGKLRQHLVPVRGDGHQVLDSHPQGTL